MAERDRAGVRGVWLLFALATYWAWGLLALSLAFTEGYATVWGSWTLNAAAHACVSLGAAFLSLRFSWHRRFYPVLITAGAGASLGTAAVVVGAHAGLPLLSCTGSLLAGGLSAPLALLMFPQLARYDAADERLGLIGGSVAASLLVALVVVSLPRPVGVVMLVALPLLAVVGALQGGDFSSVPGEGSQTPRARDAVNVPLLLCAFVFAFSVTFFRGIAGGSSGIGDQPAAFSLTFLAIAVVLVPLLAFDRLRKSPLLVFVFVPMLAAGILLLPFLVGEDRLVSSVLINTARNLFSVYLYSSLALIIASRGHGVFAAGLVVGVGDLGHVVAALWERSFGLATSLQVLVVCVAIAYVAFMCALLLFYPTRLQREVFGAAPASAGEVQSPATDVAPLELAAHEAGLSDREVEVLRLLIGSRTMASIADELGISYNTAKTHASHIFRKAGVCSREELALWVETFAE